jgi:hypothetical protein
MANRIYVDGNEAFLSLIFRRIGGIYLAFPCARFSTFR